jgi:excisionase family DNA binding protein
VRALTDLSTPMLTTRQIADLVGVSPETVLRWQRHGHGPAAIRLPSGALRYRREDVEAWLTQRSTAKPQ